MRIAVCDDHAGELNKYSGIIKNASEIQGIDVQIDEYSGGEDLLKRIDKLKCLPDVLFLDINMPDIKGIAVAQRLKEMQIPTVVVFLTVSDKHFLQAFDVNAFNYVLKNEQALKRIADILEKIEEKIQYENEDFIILTLCGKREVVPLRQIYYFESKYKIINVHYKDKSFEFSSSLGKIEEELMGKGFIRIHKAFLVSVSVIADYNRGGMLLTNGAKIPIGRTYYERVNEILSMNG